MTRIKICGIKTEEQALAAARAGADFIGVVLAASPRQVTPAAAARIAAALKKHKTAAEVVGVFVNADAGTVNRVAEACRLDRVQLSGNESWEYCREIEKPIIKAMRVNRNNPPGKVGKDIEYGMKLLKKKKVTIMLDTTAGGRYGGTGQTFDWELAGPIARRYPVIVAGGLTPANVPEAIKTLSPWGVDVSTGVETKGVKDLSKIKKFIEAARKADAGA
jgi:phosphoribosylanthranilate isomerase